MKKKIKHTENSQMGIDAQSEITKALRKECRKSCGKPLGIDAEEKLMKALRKMSKSI